MDISAHRPSFFSLSEENNEEDSGNPINGAMIERSVTFLDGLTGRTRTPCIDMTPTVD
jgi:hypothetical protein